MFDHAMNQPMHRGLGPHLRGTTPTIRGLGSFASPGTFGHGGAWGTQAWIDPVKGVAYLLMVQRSNFKNSDGSPVRLAFQEAAAAALAAAPAR